MSNYDDVAKRAYELWEEAGKPEGRETEHWLQAENEVRHRRGSKDNSRRAVQTAGTQPANERGARFVGS
jgi:hypothetical protein